MGTLACRLWGHKIARAKSMRMVSGLAVEQLPPPEGTYPVRTQDGTLVIGYSISSVSTYSHPLPKKWYRTPAKEQVGNFTEYCQRNGCGYVRHLRIDDGREKLPMWTGPSVASTTSR